MNNTFNYVRFGKLFRKHTVENYKSYLMSAGVLCGSIILFYCFLFFSMEGTLRITDQLASFCVFYLAGGAVFTSTIFSDYGKTRESITVLTLPASHFEKFLIAWLYSFLIFTGIFLLLFYAIDIPFVSAAKLSPRDAEKKVLDLFEERKIYYQVFFVYAVLHAFVMYCAIFFKKLHFIKTACLFFLLLVILIVFHTQLMKSIIPQEIYARQPFGDFQLRDNVNFFVITLDADVRYFYYMFLYFGLSLTLWAAAYFTLKEKQI